MKKINKEIDLYKEYLHTERSRSKMQPDNMLRIIVLCAVLVCVVAAVVSWMYYSSRRDALTEQLDAVAAEAVSPYITDGISVYERECADNTALTEVCSSADKLLSELYAKPQYTEYDQQLFTRLSAVMTEEILLTDIRAQDTVFELGFSARTADDISRFVKRLSDADIFARVEYSGFINEGGRYSFALICSITEREDTVQ